MPISLFLQPALRKLLMQHLANSRKGAKKLSYCFLKCQAYMMGQGIKSQGRKAKKREGLFLPGVMTLKPYSYGQIAFHGCGKKSFW